MGRSSKPVIVHVGMNKTGTTTLQRKLLPKLAGITILGNRAAPVPHPDDHVVIPAIRALCDDPDDRYSDGMLSLLTDRAAARTVERILITEEAFTSTLRHRNWDDLVRTLDRLVVELPKARIMFVMRNPADLLVSSYSQYIKTGGTMPFGAFAGAATTDDFALDPRLYNAAEIYFLLLERWGEPSVTPLLFEDLVGAPDHFLTRMIDVLGIDTDEPDVRRMVECVRERDNVSLSPLWATPERWCNRLTRRSRFNTAPLLGNVPRVHLALRASLLALDRRCASGRWPVNRRLRQVWQTTADDVAAAFRASNRRFASATGIDLALYGYAT